VKVYSVQSFENYKSSLLCGATFCTVKDMH
jgi:hypothetical protein